MAENVGVLIENLTAQLTGLTSAINTQGIAGAVDSYEGDPKKFKEWVGSIEKYASLTGIAADRIKLVAYQASKGPVGDFVKRYVEENPQGTWAELKAELASRFSEITDPQHAFVLLRKAKQKSDDSVQIFAEKLLALADEAYANMQRGNPAVEQQLVGFFVGGLLNDSLKMKVMQENPPTLREAVNVAMAEQNLRRRFQLRTNTVTKGRHVEPMDTSPTAVPMDVGHSRATRKCHNCGRTGHIAKECRSKTRQTGAGPGQYQQLCWACGNRGHFQRECPQYRQRKT
ncbi:uncharacterized protein LOC132561689 [Ylistrum balloti]|uniref:uncharacterized protein LOC132561689 n=1 Tax=Ylistrum balloti TaxID=509963 RepID=UPI002905835C|nr:uncharacterized protein LOC132561689 [Ylistrum balloti]